MKLAAKTLAAGVGAYTVTGVAAYVLLWGPFLAFLLLASNGPSVDFPWPPHAAVALLLVVVIVLNLVLAGTVVLVPIGVASWAGRCLGVPPAATLLVAATLLGITAIWFLQGLSVVNGCLTGVAFPLGGGRGFCNGG